MHSQALCVVPSDDDPIQALPTTSAPTPNPTDSLVTCTSSARKADPEPNATITFNFNLLKAYVMAHMLLTPIIAVVLDNNLAAMPSSSLFR